MDSQQCWKVFNRIKKLHKEGFLVSTAMQPHFFGEGGICVKFLEKELNIKILPDEIELSLTTIEAFLNIF